MSTKLNLKLCFLLLASILVGCGSNDNGRQAFGNGFIGNGFVDQQIIGQIPCNSSVGPQARTTIGFRTINGMTQPLNNANIPNPSMGFSTTAIGRTTYGDVVILTQSGGASDLIISLCHRSYIQSNTVNQINASGFLVDSNSFCGYSALVSGVIQIGFGSNFGPPVTEILYPRPLYESMPGMNCQF